MLFSSKREEIKTIKGREYVVLSDREVIGNHMDIICGNDLTSSVLLYILTIKKESRDDILSAISAGNLDDFLYDKVSAVVNNLFVRNINEFYWTVQHLIETDCLVNINIDEFKFLLNIVYLYSIRQGHDVEDKEYSLGYFCFYFIDTIESNHINKLNAVGGELITRKSTYHHHLDDIKKELPKLLSKEEFNRYRIYVLENKLS